jgi:hypothetical protein
VLNITNHVVFALFDGEPGSATSALLDFENLGPFGVSISMTNLIAAIGGNPLGVGGGAVNYFAPGVATSSPNSPMSQGVLNQIYAGEATNQTFANDLLGKGPPLSASAILECPCTPTYVIIQQTNWVANDPLVHYTMDDLTWTTDPTATNAAYDLNVPQTVPPPTNSIGTLTSRYAPWGKGQGRGGSAANEDMLLKDPQMWTSTNWNFPTGKFPNVGTLGRVHRGTPWQTVYFKADNPSGDPAAVNAWATWVSPNGINSPNALENYPTNDWILADLFTTATDDNAATGLLSVNQTNIEAWAAVFCGVFAPTNATNGIQIMPNNNGPLGSLQNFTNLVDATSPYYGLNAVRTNYPNGILHKVGYVLGAAALTTQSPLLGGTAASAGNYPDEIVERIPQQTLSLMKVGEPQFVIFAWGQSLKPKGLPYLNTGGFNNNIYTNYEITGEVLTRTVCHLVRTNGVKMVIDSYNVESGSGN